LVEGIRAAIGEISGDADITLVEGPDLTLLQRIDPAPGRELAPVADARTVLVFGYEPGLEAASIARAAEDFGEHLAGVVINGFLRHHRREVNQGLVGELRSRGVPALGAIPEERVMLSVTVRQIAEYLGGCWLQGPEDTEAWVDRFLIGGNIMDSGPNYFGRYPNQAVITRAERPDIQLASLMCDTKCLVLTGGAEPTEYIKAEASKREVPILLVAEDTLTTAETLGGLLDASGPHSLYKARHFARRIGDHLDLAALHSALA
jgi:BioD-like phosphotransacetylase family protein